MAQAQIYNEATGQYEDDPNQPPKPGNTAADASQPKSFNPFDRAAIMRDWMGSGTSYGGDFSKFIADKNYNPADFTQISGTNGAWAFNPTGEAMDLVIDKGGRNQAAWTGLGDYKNGVVTPYANSGSSVAQQWTVQPATSSSQVSLSTEEQAKQTQDAALRKQLIDQLTQRAQQGLAIDPNTDPVIRAQADAYNAQQERAKRNYLADIAEKAGPVANLRGETRLANEQYGQQTSAFQAELMGRELTARREEIAQALTSMQGMLTTDEQISLQKELATMDDAIKRLQLQQNADQFGASQAQQASQFGQTLSNNQAQFGANRSLDTQKFIADLLAKGVDPTAIQGYLSSIQ